MAVSMLARAEQSVDSRSVIWSENPVRSALFEGAVSVEVMMTALGLRYDLASMASAAWRDAWHWLQTKAKYHRGEEWAGQSSVIRACRGWGVMSRGSLLTVVG